jgi:alpha-mannosidase
MSTALDRPIVHLFCNAHLDPVWMWTWEEGAREAISTFRTAVNLLDEFPEFIFNHNESLLYEWVEEYDPPLFERIRRRVREGRWNITGGWYLQPDVNLPGGETLVRVILEGRRYFAEKFGVRPPLAYNFDSFGHPASLPQMLVQSGFEFYIHCRPVESQLELPAPLYRWRGVDGSEVIALRPDAGWYGTPWPGQAQAQARKGIEIARATGRDVLVTWGLGDHGGGATRQELLAFRQLFAEVAGDDIEIRHSTPEAYLNRIRRYAAELPVYTGDLQRTLSGTYTSVATVKKQMRESEARLASAERWASIAWWRFGRPYPEAELRAAWKRLMFNAFHDILCGSLIEDALPGVSDIFGYAQDAARRIIVRAQNALLPNVPPADDTVPLYVFNPHSSALRAHVGINFLSAYAPPSERRPFALYDDTGARLPIQTSGGNAVLAGGTWQPFIGFIADVPPLAVRRYEIRFEEAAVPNAGMLSTSEGDTGITVENAWWRLRFSRDLAAPVELYHKPSGRSLLKAPAQLFAMRDVGHAWGGENRVVYNQPVSPLLALTPAEVGAFTGVEDQTGPALRIIAQGPVSVTVECLVGWQHTRAALRFTLYADLPAVDLDLRLYMQARRKMLKFALPFDLPDPRITGEVPYGAAERAADATEYPYSRWIRLETPELAVGVANNGQAGFDASDDGTLRLSLTRGAVHCSWEGDPNTQPPDPAQSYTYMDQTQLDLRFRLLADTNPQKLAADLIPAALELHQPLERFFAFHAPTPPAEAPSAPVPFLSVEPATIALGALKKAEDAEALVVRLVETTGQATTAQVKLEDGAVQEIRFRPFEIKTYMIARQGERITWTACNLLEEKPALPILGE